MFYCRTDPTDPTDFYCRTELHFIILAQSRRVIRVLSSIYTSVYSLFHAQPNVLCASSVSSAALREKKTVRENNFRAFCVFCGTLISSLLLYYFLCDL